MSERIDRIKEKFGKFGPNLSEEDEKWAQKVSDNIVADWQGLKWMSEHHDVNAPEVRYVIGLLGSLSTAGILDVDAKGKDKAIIAMGIIGAATDQYIAQQSKKEEN